AAVRWGSNVQALLAALSFYALLLNLPGARGLWAVAALVVVPIALDRSSAAALAPRHRRSCEVVLAVSLVALYAAVHVGSWDGRVLESIGGAGIDDPRSSPLRPLFVVGTAAVPLGLLALGIARRRRLL